MKQFNRRNWLKFAGATGAATILNPLKGISASDDQLPFISPDDSNSIAKLSFNENPFAPSPRVRKAIIAALDEGCRYPFRKIQELQGIIANKEGVSSEEIVVTGGSTEGLKATGLTLGVRGGQIIAANPTYQSLLSYAEHFGCHINRVPLDEDLMHDLEEMEKRVTHETKMIFICNPNNPSGTILPADRMKDFCERLSKKTIVFSDEAYGEYITEPNYPSMISLVKEGKNVIVSRTFSKVYGLAGLRIGYIIARPDIANRIRPSVMASTNMLAVYAAMEAMKDHDFYNESLKMNMDAKNHIYSVLDDLNLRYIKSHTNFVFFHTGQPIRKIMAGMSDRNVWVGRPFPPLTDWCRVSTGRMEDVKRFGVALKEIMT